MSTPREATIIGAGLAGALMATLLAQRGWKVEVLEAITPEVCSEIVRSTSAFTCQPQWLALG